MGERLIECRAVAPSYDLEQPAVRIPRKVIKGGSYLCASMRRQLLPQIPANGTAIRRWRHRHVHIGFCCVVRTKLRKETKGEAW